MEWMRLNDLILCLTAVLPILLIALCGYGARRAGLIRAEDVPRANKWAFAVFMPLMCFYNIYQSDLSSALRPRLIAFAIVAILAVYALSLAWVCVFVKKKESRGVMIQGLFRSNFVILGLPLAAGLAPDGDLGVAAVMAAFVVPCFNVLAVITLEAFRGQRPKASELLLGILKNPLILGSVAGLLALILKLHLPAFLESPIRDMGKAASPVMLFLLGASIRPEPDASRRRLGAIVCVGRLLVIPALVLTAAVLLGFRGIELVTLLAVFASPTAVASFTMAEQLGGDAPLAGKIVVITSTLCPLTIFGWSYLLKVLGLF